MMAVAYTLLRMGEERELFLYDTFAGMPTPSSRDVQFDGSLAAALLRRASKRSHMRGVAAIEEVKANLQSTGFPVDRIHIVAGPVEETIPAAVMPGAIALLRLDTDWYESTLHELTHLYPILRAHGILIIDDYGHWRGARDATDEYFGARGFRPFLHRIDYTGVVAVKPAV